MFLQSFIFLNSLTVISATIGRVLHSPVNVPENETNVDNNGNLIVINEGRAQMKGADIPLGLKFGETGCGIHRDCLSCKSLKDVGCYWDPNVGCFQLPRGITKRSDCSGLVQVGEIKGTCDQFLDCKHCTGQSGCVWYQGICQYSSGAGCRLDYLNCANAPSDCPAYLPVTTQYHSHANHHPRVYSHYSHHYNNHHPISVSAENIYAHPQHVYTETLPYRSSFVRQPFHEPNPIYTGSVPVHRVIEQPVHRVVEQPVIHRNVYSHNTFVPTYYSSPISGVWPPFGHYSSEYHW
jgi:hypothetical protein